MKDFIRLLEFFKPYKVRLVAAFIFSGLVAALTGAYAWLVRPVLDGIFIDKDTFLLNVLPLAILAVAVMKAAFSYGQNYLMNYVGNQVITDIRERLFLQLMRLPVRFHDSNTSGRLVSRVINDVNMMANAVVGVLKDLFQQGLTFLAMFGVILYQNWKLAAVSLLVIPISSFTMVRMGQRLRSLATRGQERMKRGQFDAAILFQNAFEAALLTFLAGIPYRYGYATDGRGILLSEGIAVPERTSLEHHTQYYLNLLHPLGISVSSTAPRLYVNEQEERSMFDSAERLRISRRLGKRHRD